MFGVVSLYIGRGIGSLSLSPPLSLPLFISLSLSHLLSLTPIESKKGCRIEISVITSFHFAAVTCFPIIGLSRDERPFDDTGGDVTVDDDFRARERL